MRLSRTIPRPTHQTAYAKRAHARLQEGVLINETLYSYVELEHEAAGAVFRV